MFRYSALLTLAAVLHQPPSVRQRIAVLMRAGGVPGMSIAVTHGGRLAWTAGLGWADQEHRVPVTDSTVFEAASLSKPVFALVVLRLVAVGRLSLDTPLTHYFDSSITADPRAGRLTARQLLMHASGFPDWRPLGMPLRMYFEPGSRFSYSGEGMQYLQRVVEHVTGRSVEDLAREAVFVPLEMSYSSYVWRSDYDRLKATAYDAVGHPVAQWRPKRANVAFSLHTTAGDYARFLLALYQDSTRPMLVSRMPVSTACIYCTDGQPIRLSNEVSWGLGIGIERTPRSWAVWHWGNNGERQAYAVMRLDTGDGVTVFANSANALGIMTDIVHLVLGGREPALDWLDQGDEFEPYDSPSRTLFDAIVRNGYAIAVRQRPGTLEARRYNDLGQRLLVAQRPVDAESVFALAARRYPGRHEPYDGLAAALLAAGDTNRALIVYRHALVIDSLDAIAAGALHPLAVR
jgi:CubicO group peptidase (beta-lactamase class C family)